MPLSPVLLVGLVPGSPLPKLDPEIVFFVFLPPILWSAAYGTSVREALASSWLRPNLCHRAYIAPLSRFESPNADRS